MATTTRFTTLSVTRLAPRASYHNFANRLTRAASRRRGRVLHGTIVARSALRQAFGARRAASGTASAPASASTAAGAAHKTVSAAAGSGSGAGSNASNARTATGLKAWWAEYGEKAKRMFRTYGAVGFVWYFGLYFFTWVSVCVCLVGLACVSPHLRAYVCVVHLLLQGSFWFAVHSKWIKGPNVSKWLNNNQYVQKLTGGKPVHLNPIVEEVGMAWLVNHTHRPSFVWTASIAHFTCQHCWPPTADQAN